VTAKGCGLFGPSDSFDVAFTDANELNHTVSQLGGSAFERELNVVETLHARIKMSRRMTFRTRGQLQFV